MVIPWLVPFLYAFQFIKLNDGVAGIVIIIVATITSHIAWNIPFVANISMINIGNKNRRTESSSRRALRGARYGSLFFPNRGLSILEREPKIHTVDRLSLVL